MSKSLCVGAEIKPMFMNAKGFSLHRQAKTYRITSGKISMEGVTPMSKKSLSALLIAVVVLAAAVSLVGLPVSKFGAGVAKADYATGCSSIGFQVRLFRNTTVYLDAGLTIPLLTIDTVGVKTRQKFIACNITKESWSVFLYGSRLVFVPVGSGEVVLRVLRDDQQ
jgi:hypothetical protein